MNCKKTFEFSELLGFEILVKGCVNLCIDWVDGIDLYLYMEGLENQAATLNFIH